MNRTARCTHPKSDPMSVLRPLLLLLVYMGVWATGLTHAPTIDSKVVVSVPLALLCYMAIGDFLLALFRYHK